jgi:hypothetical protein
MATLRVATRTQIIRLPFVLDGGEADVAGALP